MNTQSKKRIIKAGSWVLLGHIFSQLIRLGGNLFLTRLLIPEMFGVMAIVNVITAGLAMFSDVGLLQNIVQSERGEQSRYLNTAWTLQVIRGFVVALLTLAIGAVLYTLGQYGYLPAHNVYGHVELPFILAVISLAPLASGFNSIHLLRLNRKLQMSKLITIEIMGQITGLIFMLVFAWKTQSIWALVFGNIISASVKMLLSHLLKLGARCRFCWDKSAVYEIIHFGKWILILSIIGFLIKQGDRLLLGGLISAELLGVYSVAFFLSTAVKRLLTKLIRSVFFPVLSETKRKHPKQLAQVYYNLRFKIDSVAILTGSFLWFMGSTLVNFLYDSRYSEAGWMLEILSLSLFATSTALTNQLFIALGKPNINVFFASIQATMLYLLLPIAFGYNLKWALIVVVAHVYLRWLLSIFYLYYLRMLNIKREILSFMPVVLILFSAQALQELMIWADIFYIYCVDLKIFREFIMWIETL